MPPTSRRVAGVPGLALDHVGEQREAQRDDLAVLGKIVYRLTQKPILSIGEFARAVRQVPICGAKRHQYFPCVSRVEEIDRRRVVSQEKLDFQGIHEPVRCHPEVDPDHHGGLRMLTFALPQGGNQFRVFRAALGVKPLLELVKDKQQQLLSRSQYPSFAYVGECVH